MAAAPNTGYHFTSWSDGVSTATRQELDVTTDLTVTANFAIDTYTLTYNTGPNGSISGPNPQIVDHGSNGATVTAVPETGYHFDGWSDGVSTASRQELNVTAGLTVTASFAVSQFTVTYDGNGSDGGGAPSGNPFTYDYKDTVTVKDNSGTFSKTGYTFTGWNTAADAGGTHYDAGATFEMGAANVTLYAHWTNLDPTFVIGDGANGSIFEIAIQSDDKILIAGDFSSYNSVTRQYIARIEVDGGLDAAFVSGTNNNVYAIAIQKNSPNDGKIIIGGTFFLYNGAFRYAIARINPADGSLDGSFNPGSGPDGGGFYSPFIFDIAIQSNDYILIGGRFSTFSGSAKEHIARLEPDGAVDSGFTGAVNDRVEDIALQGDGKILIGGDWFSSYSGKSRNRIARINADGTLDESFDPGAGIGGGVRATAIQDDGKILIGGSFSSYNGTTRRRIARLNENGTLDTAFDPGSGTNGSVNSIGIQSGGKIVIGGEFTAYNGTPRNRIARINP